MTAPRVLIVTGAGGQAFCAGADLKAMNNPANAPEGPMGFTRLQSPKPTIAAIEGWCVAGGLEIACWCDIRIGAEGARFGVLNRRWGVPLIDGGTQRLPRIVGLGRALDLILTGRIVEHDEALAIGLVSRLVPQGEALDAALAVAEQIAGFPRECLLADRHCVYDGLGQHAHRWAQDGSRLRTKRHRPRAAGRGPLRLRRRPQRCWRGGSAQSGR